MALTKEDLKNIDKAVIYAGSAGWDTYKKQLDKFAEETKAWSNENLKVSFDWAKWGKAPEPFFPKPECIIEDMFDVYCGLCKSYTNCKIEISCYKGVVGSNTLVCPCGHSWYV